MRSRESPTWDVGFGTTSREGCWGELRKEWLTCTYFIHVVLSLLQMANVATIHGIEASGHCLLGWRTGGRGNAFSLPIARKRAQKISVGDHVGDRTCRHPAASPEEPPGKRAATHSRLCLDGNVARNRASVGERSMPQGHSHTREALTVLILSSVHDSPLMWWLDLQPDKPEHLCSDKSKILTRVMHLRTLKGLRISQNKTVGKARGRTPCCHVLILLITAIHIL